MSDIADFERGKDVCEQELKIMYSNANDDQKSIFHHVIHELQLNSVTFISGAAGTGKSFVLRMLERFYKRVDFKVSSNNCIKAKARPLILCKNRFSN